MYRQSQGSRLIPHTQPWRRRPHTAQRIGRLAAICFFFLALSVLPAAASEWLYTVRPGDNLWNITERHLKHIRYWKRLWTLNQVEDPWRILPGTRLRIPLDWVKLRPAPARVLDIRGQVFARRANQQQAIAAVPGMELATGDQLTTGPQSSATIEFGDRSSMLVESESELVFDMLRAYGDSGFVDTRVRLNRGGTEHKVSPRPGRDTPRYEIITPAATSVVRGTLYRMDAARDQDASATEVLGGLVKIEAAGQSRLVPEGFGVVARRDAPPPVPKRLLPAPVFGERPAPFERVPVRLELPAVEGAAAYRLQVADTQQFLTLRYDAVLATPRVGDINLPDGDYILRLRGIDATGLEGLDAYQGFSIDARPEPPILVSPAPAAQFGTDQVELAWARPEGAVAFHLQVAREATFAQPLVDIQDVDKAGYVLDGLTDPGLYHWRLATRDASGETGPFSDPQSFKRLVDAPVFEASDVAKDEVTFRWARGLPGDSYELQVARDAAFTDILETQRVSEPTHRITRPESGVYFLRVRTIDQAGDPGPFGATQRIEIPPGSYWPLVVPLLMLLIAL